MWLEALFVLLSLLLAYLLHHLLIKKKRGWVGYWWRRGRVAAQVWAARAGTATRINNYKQSSDDYLHCGVEATPSEKDLEQPKPFITDRHEDEVSLSGVDLEGRAVVVRVARLSQRRASAFLSVTDHTGAVYTLPNQPDTNQVNVGDAGWCAAGLSVTCVDPMRCWRVKFNGLLRRGAREVYVTEGEEEDEEEEIIHARLDLLWRSMRSPVDLWAEVSPALLSRALAPHPHAALHDYLAEENEGYEQWGALHGTVSFSQDAKPEVWYLRGPRRHRWGLSRAVSRAFSTYVYFMNGDVFSLRAHISAATTTATTTAPQYMSGYLQKAAGFLHPVTWCDLDLTHLDQLARLGNNLLIKFKAGGRVYETWQRLGREVTYYTGDPWTMEHRLHPAHAATSLTHGRALTLLSSRFDGLCPVPERESLPQVEPPRREVGNGAPLVVVLEDPRCRDPSLVGGKGASLALLMAYRELLDPSQEQYEVPPGVVVTSAAWEAQLASCPDLQQALRNLRLTSASDQPTRLKEACARAVEVCSGATVCEAVAEALRSALEGAVDDRSRLAVRSSGCAEDGEEASAAGQNETVLGVQGRGDHLLRALTACWASLFSFHSVEYRRQRGQPVEVGMGVVVQEMVEAEAAGVIFTVDPVTGSPAAITITANYGLGESVVSASAEPDTLVVERSWRDTLTMRSTTLGSKGSKCVMKEGGGTEEVVVVTEARERACVSEGEALRLARVAIYLQQAFASPRDLEFALVQGEVVVLQARPITTLDTWTDYELTHELDTVLPTDLEPVTKANTGEVLPGSISPLTLSFFPLLLDLSFQEDYSKQIWTRGHTPTPHHLTMCPSFYTQVFLNMVETQYRSVEKEGEVTPAQMGIDLAVFGHSVTTREFLRLAIERFGTLSGFELLITLLSFVRSKLTIGARLRKARAKFGEYKVGGQGKGVSAATLHAEISRRLTDLPQVNKVHLTTSKLSSVSQCMAFVMLAGEKKELTKDNILDMAAILSSCSGVESADVPRALKDLARVITENEELEEFKSMTLDEGQVWLQSHPGVVGTTFREFLARHGHRSIKEFDLHSLSWRLDPLSLIHTLQVMVRHPADHDPSQHEPPSLDHILDNLRSPLSSSIRRGLKFLLPICREMVAEREASKSLLIKVVDGLRSGYRELGALLVSEGRLPSPELVFFLKHSELGELVADPCPALLAKAVGRRRLHSQLDNLKFPEISIGLPRPVEAAAARREEGEAGEVLVGTPVCLGAATGTARVITSLQDITAIQSGDILVTVSTDVGWTPCFPMLAGVVTELGGLCSHGAVVAREYGLPCLVGVTAATQVFRSGDRVLLDASRGTLTRLHPVPSTPTPAPAPSPPAVAPKSRGQ